eukprot:COSAG05_NODE_2667_length_2783_cov_7.122951_6_plen_23_part_01
MELVELLLIIDIAAAIIYCFYLS